MHIFFFLSCPLHPISSSCAEVFHESTDQTQSLRTPSLPGVTSSCVLGKRFFPHLGMCIIQRNHQGTPAYLPCNLHLKGSLVGLGTLIHVGPTCKCSWEENNLRIFLSSYVSGWFILAWTNLCLAAISRGALKGKVGLVRVYLKIPHCKVFSSRSAASPSARQRVNGGFSLSQSENPISTLWVRAQENL